MNILFYHFIIERRRVSDGDLSSSFSRIFGEIFRDSPTNSPHGEINLLTFYDFNDTQWNLLRAGNARAAHVRIIPYYRPRGTIEWWKRPRFSRRTYLSSLGRVTVKPPVDSTRQRYWGSSSSAARHFVFGNVGTSCRFSFPLAYFARRRLSCSFSIYFVHEPFDPPFIRSFTWSAIRQIRSYIHLS